MNRDRFGGFLPPTANWSKLPHQFIDALPLFSSMSEMKVVLYVLRHTWGFQEFDKLKRITLDEFRNGRKRRDGSRLDNGTGLSGNAIKDGIKRAVEHGFMIQCSDGRDSGRSSHTYQLRVSNFDRVSEVDTQVSKVDTQVSEVDTRSEKDTKESYLGNPGAPDYLPHCAGIAEKQQREKEWSVAGSNGLVAETITYLYELLGSKPPKEGGGTWRKLFDTIEPVLKEYDVTEIAPVRTALARFREEKPVTFDPFYKSFPGQLGTYLGQQDGKGRKVIREDADRKVIKVRR